MMTPKRQQDRLREAAEAYARMATEVKELEARMAPLKKELTDYAASVGLTSLNLGALTIERSTTVTAIVDPLKVTPDWLYRMQRDGYYHAVSVKVDPRKMDEDDERGNTYLQEVGLEEKARHSYRLRLNVRTEPQEGGAE